MPGYQRLDIFWITLYLEYNETQIYMKIRLKKKKNQKDKEKNVSSMKCIIYAVHLRSWMLKLT